MIKFSHLIGDISVGMLLLDSNCRVWYANAAIKEMMRRHDLRGLHLLELLDDSTPTASGTTHQLLHKPAHWRGDVNLRRQGESSLPSCLVVDRYEEGGSSYYSCVLCDISEYKRVQSELTQLSLLDALTGLSNRVGFMRLLERALLGLRRETDRLALLFVDIDDFKKVNDFWGHAVGDQCLQEVARRLDATVHAWRSFASATAGSESGPSTFISRLGGDEFVVLISRPSVDGALQMAHKISTALSEPSYIRGQKLDLSASIGIAYAPAHAASAQELIQRADQAMYYAKSHCKGAPCEFFHQLLAETQIPLEFDFNDS